MATELLTADAPSASAFGVPQWGIFGEGGTPILAVDSVADVDYARDYRISDYPQEQGAFQSYNKVKIPFQAKIGFLISSTRQDCLAAVEKTVALLDLVTVVTPEVRYDSANLTHYGYRRDARSGVTMIRVEVWAQEVRIVGSSVPSTTQSTNGALPQDSGQVQPVPAGDVTPAVDTTLAEAATAAEAAERAEAAAATNTNPPLTPPK